MTTAVRAGQVVKHLDSAWLRFEYDLYGPAGCETKQQHVVLPLCPAPMPSPVWRPSIHAPHATTLPVHTHLLCHFDDPVRSPAATPVQACSNAISLI